MSAESKARDANRLIGEKSPYLLQHAHNPVDWYPWGEEAFAKAKREDKPVFLSIGYSTCYWCHVMEQESFENPEVAALLNGSFVPIKVDREERPDLDAIYMAAVQAMSGQGGWPMTVFLTPEGKPFWGGTYFPPEERWGRPGLKAILRSLGEAWQKRREDILRSSQSLTQAIQASSGLDVRAAAFPELIETAVQQLRQQYDAVDGGFGTAPKFPRPHVLSFLLRVWSRRKDPALLEIVTRTLEAMADGGIHDHLGGGFHRYATDAKWLVPHFEKMLYDQALAAVAYLEAFQTTGNPRCAQVARGVLEYALRDLKDPQGAFYCAEDAGEAGREGEFYVWTPDEIERILGVAEARLVSGFYGVASGGNFERGTSVLHAVASPEAFAGQEGLPAGSLAGRLAAARAKLLAARDQRPRPHRDDKILTDWNGLMIGALAYGARALDEPRYARAAETAASFLLSHLQPDGALLHRYRDGAAGIPAFLDDHAFLSWGLAQLYETTFEARWLKAAVHLTQESIRLFWDSREGGFFLTGDPHGPLIARTKELYDGALPSGNSVAALNLLRLGHLTMNEEFQRLAERLLQAFSGHAAQLPSSFPQYLLALDFQLGPAQEIIIAGDPAEPDTQEMIRMVHQRFLPQAVVALHPSGQASEQIEALIPFLKAHQPLRGRATAFVCEQYVCRLPAADPSQLKERLQRLP